MVSNQPHTVAAKDARIATVAPAKPPRLTWWRRHFQHEGSNNSHNPPVESWCAEGRRSAPECLQSPGVPNAPAARR
jgi:hypothetical protein